MDTPDIKMEQPQNPKEDPDLTVLTNSNSGSIKGHSDDELTIIASGLSGKKSISVIGDLVPHTSIRNEKSEVEEPNDGTFSKKSNRRDKSRTIECLTLVAKPRFQKVTTDIFKPFLTRKSEVVVQEKMKYEPEPSAILELKYPMLKVPVQKQEGKKDKPSKNKKPPGSDTSVHNEKFSKLNKFPPKIIDGEHDKVVHDRTSTTSARNVKQGDDGISNKNSQDLDIKHAHFSKKTKKSKKSGLARTSIVSTSSDTQAGVINQKHENKTKITKTRKTEKEIRPPSDKNTSEEEFTEDLSFKTKENQAVNISAAPLDGIIVNSETWVDEITLGDIIGHAISDNLSILEMASENMESAPSGHDAKVEMKNEVADLKKYTSSEREDTLELRTTYTSHSLPKYPGISKHSLPTTSRSSSFIAKTKDRIFKDFLKTESPPNVEDASEIRRSFFDYPSVLHMHDEDRLKSIDTRENPFGTLLLKGKDDSVRELLPAISTTTARLLSMLEPNIESQGSEKSVSEKRAKTTFSEVNTELIDQKTMRNLDVMTEILGTLNESVNEQKGKVCQCKYSPCSIDKEHDTISRNVLPDQFTHDEFMRYFCEDWAQPKTPDANLQKEGNIDEVFPTSSSAVLDNLEEDDRSEFSILLDKIDDDEVYDLIFSYKLPKTAPFDLKDSIEETRTKCIDKWLEKTGDMLYRTTFEEEVKAKAEEKIIKQLFDKADLLCRKINRYNCCPDTNSAPSVETNVTSESTFSIIQEDAEQPRPEAEASISCGTGVRPTSNAPHEEEVPAETTENTTENTSDSKILDIAIEKLIRKLGEPTVSFEDDYNEDSEKHTSTEELRDDYIDQPLSNQGVVMESRGTKRRRKIKEVLEKLIDLLEKKIVQMKTRKMIIYRGEDEEAEVITIQKDLSLTSCHCPDNKEDPAPEQPVHPIDAILMNYPTVIRDYFKKLPVGTEEPIEANTENQDMTVSTKSNLLQHKLPDDLDTLSLGNKNHLKRGLSKRNLLQLYLLDYLDTWNPKREDQEKQPSEHVEEMRLIDKLEELQKLEGENRPASETSNAVQNESLDVNANEEKSPANIPTTESPQTITPFTCNCFCDRISRFSPKKNQHFRTVLNDHLWCLRSDPHILDDKHDWNKSSVELPTQWSLCPPKETEQPDNFQGWLADTDRNLLLLMSRPAMDRIDKDYYKKTATENEVPRSLQEQVDEQARKEKQLQERVDQLSKDGAEMFWKTVSRWYKDYKKRDKVRLMLELFQDIDLNAMLQRDLEFMKEELAENMKIVKEDLRVKIEQEKKDKFDRDVKKLLSNYSCRLRNRLEAKRNEMKSKREFLVRCMQVEAKENFEPIIEKYKKKCIEWIETVRDKQNKTSLTQNQRTARELALIVDKCDVGERVRRKLLGATGKEHEEVEKVLGKAIESRDIVIEGLKSNVINLTRDVNIWKRAVGEVLKSFKNFVHYILETRPDRAQYALSLEKLYQLQMDDLIRNANNELETDETKEIKPAARRSETLQPTMEIKCPSHDIRYPSEHSGKTGSSSDTDIEEDIKARKVVDHAVDAAIRDVLPTPELSVAEETEDELKELERLITLIQRDDSQEIKIESVSSEEVCGEDQIDHERLTHVIGEGASDPCISVEEFTKRRIREMLEIIARKKPFIRPHVHL